MQDAFLFAIRKIDSFRGESAFGSWLYRIVANAAYQHCRRRGGRVADVSLPADYRVVELLRDVDGLSHQEIAETLGLSVANVRKRVHRARLFLRKRLEAHLSSAGIESTPSVA